MAAIRDPLRPTQRDAATPRFGAHNHVQRVPGRCVECGGTVVAAARGPIAKRCARCTGLRRRQQQLHAYVVSAIKTAQELGRADVADQLSVTLRHIDREAAGANSGPVRPASGVRIAVLHEVSPARIAVAGASS